PVGDRVRAALGIRREIPNPTIPSEGKVWVSITTHIDEPGWNDEWITVSDLDRPLLSAHPWSLAGGGAIELRKKIEEAPVLLSEKSESTGISAFTLEDEVYVADRSSFSTRGIENNLRELATGDAVRDWSPLDCPIV